MRLQFRDTVRGAVQLTRRWRGFPKWRCYKSDAMILGARHSTVRRVTSPGGTSVTEVRAIEYGLEGLNHLSIRLSPHDDVDRAIMYYIRPYCALSTEELRVVRAVLLEHVFENLHGVRWQRDDRSYQCQELLRAAMTA